MFGIRKPDAIKNHDTAIAPLTTAPRINTLFNIEYGFVFICVRCLMHLTAVGFAASIRRPGKKRRKRREKLVLRARKSACYTAKNSMNKTTLLDPIPISER